MKGNLFIICSPSGGGKGTLLVKLRKTVPNVYDSVSFTTRQPREGEQHGREYFFVTKENFENLIEQGEFLEFANVHGNYYGTSLSQVNQEIEAGKDIILEIDVQGAEIVKKKAPDAISIFILPLSFEILEKRLTERNTETQENLKIRLNNAKTEVKFSEKFDYVIINDEIEKASNLLISIFLAERAKTTAQKEIIKAILKTFE